MDISSLLSPSDSPAGTPAPHAPPSLASPSLLQQASNRAIRQTPSHMPSALSRQLTSSPQSQVVLHHQLPSPGYIHIANGPRPVLSTTSTPQSFPSSHELRMQDTHTTYRQNTTAGMDTLADLASTQQASRSSMGGPQRPVTLLHLGQHISGESVVTAMSEPAAQPRDFTTKSLDQQHIDWLTQLDKALVENPFDYYSHVSLVTALHQGFEKHLSILDADPTSYELVQTLRDAYKAMSDKYPLGELLWHYRLNDEKTLAQKAEDRMGVLELHKQATQEEPYSAKLWAAYSEYVSYLVACSWDQESPEEWSDEERLIGRELFTPKLLLEALQQGAEKVKYNLQESNLVWDRYLQVLEEDLERGGFSQENAVRVAAIFNDRLSQPHATWSNTLSRYASFNSRYNKNHYEEVMEQAVQKNSHIKQQYANHEEYEFKLLQAIQASDQDAEHHVMTRYLKWAKKTVGVYSSHLVNALYARATLRFPVDASIWEDHVEFLIWQQERWPQDRTMDLLDVLERATRHCPWSGSLWSHRILSLEAEQKAFVDIEHVKHTATGSGLLEHTDLEELIKVQIAWCGYLRRKAFDDPRAIEDDIDVAEVGIRSALEFVKEVGMKKHGREWADTKYRLERIHMKFWLQHGRVEEARKIWNSLAELQADSYDFWYRWYIFEMVAWSRHATRTDLNANQQLQTPARASAVLERGMKFLPTMDRPEPLLEMFLNHCEQHESVLKLRSAAIEHRRAERLVSIRREKERATAIAAQQESAEGQATPGSGKRKREETTTENNDSAAKKSKHADEKDGPGAMNGLARPYSEAPSDIRSTEPKRDREHTSVVVKGLPVGTSQVRIRQFFTDAGVVQNVTLKDEIDSVTAIVEFADPAEASYALSKQAKGFEGYNISIEHDTNTTLFVTNYPAQADEAYLRNLFEPFGEIIDIRFPSLKFKTNRRYCYIQFARADNTVAATQLNGTDVEGLKITSLISDPSAKKQRDGATAEGREVYVWHLNFKIRVKEIKEVFAPFGVIERIKCPTSKHSGNNKGFCYIVYESKEQALKAVEEMHGKHMWGLDLQVQIASDKEAKAKVQSNLENVDASTTRSATPGKKESLSEANAKPVSFTARTIAILNLPDTVPDARLKPLVEPYNFKKIKLEPQRGGALIEFTTVEDAGKAGIALEGMDFEGRKLKIGTVQELNTQKGEWKAGNNFMQQKQISRPTARGGRGRGRPGLGYHPVNRFTTSTGVDVKSNADFRAQFLKQPAKESVKEEQGKEENTTAQTERH